MLGRRGILVHSWKQARPSLPHRPGLASHPFQPVLAQLRHHFANLGTLQILEEVGLVRCARRQPPPQQSLQLPHLRVCSLCSSGHCSSQTLSQLAQALSQTPLVCFLSSAPGAAGCSRLSVSSLLVLTLQSHPLRRALRCLPQGLQPLIQLLERQALLPCDEPGSMDVAKAKESRFDRLATFVRLSRLAARTTRSVSPNGVGPAGWPNRIRVRVVRARRFSLSTRRFRIGRALIGAG
mmetsp:Transcript_42378/g.113348  ORF Transcript_42378/g.113348 Transcript_42378/m.113348 type:complete len:237 (+) Transcript_42378:416-1126(+)